MTTETVTPYRSELPQRRDGFAQLLRAEWTKLRTVRGWLIGLGIAAVVTVLVGVLGPLGSSISCIGPNGRACTVPQLPLGPGGEPVTDNFYFVHQPLAGNGTITVRVTSLTGAHPDFAATGNGQSGLQTASGVQAWAKAGLMIKGDISQGSTYAAVMVTGSHGVRMQYDYTHDTAGLTGIVSADSPRWLRLTRSGDTVTGYDSTDGVQWNTIETVTLTGLSSTAQVGLFATSPEYQVITDSFGGSSGDSGPSRATAGFDDVGLQNASAQGAWTGTAVGGADLKSGLESGFQQSGAAFTVSGSGDIAPIVPGQGGRTKTIADSLVGAFAGLIAIVVVAAMFITAEYRRGLIRTTLAASPRRGRMLAAKAVVIGAAAFVVGLIAAGVAIPIVTKLEHDKTLYVFPISTLTELRVIVGTAALLAAAAVFALAIGTMLRRSAGAVATMIVVIVLPYILSVASILPSGAAEWLTRLTPAAAFAIQQTVPQYAQVTASYTPSAGFFPLSPWAGLGVLCAYAAAALALATVLLRRRDA